MSLILKKEKRQNLSNLKVFVEDNSLFSPNYFKVSDVPQILQKGKNLLRIKGNSDNLVAGSQLLIDVRDANGNEIFFEIPDFIEDDKGRIISIFVYHDKGDDNTPNGDATITIVGTAKFDLNGNPIPKQFQNIPNVRWSETVTVDRDRGNTSPIIFNTTTLPTVTVSESIETYTDIQKGSGLPTKTTTTGTDAKYLFKGSTPIVQTSTSTPFNQEMVDGTLFLDSFTNPATSVTSIKNPTNITSYTSSIVEVLDNQTVKLATPFTTTFDNRVGLTHTFSNIDIASYKIEHFSTGSNTTTENQTSFVNLIISGSDPMVGVVDTVTVLIKSDGLDGEFELLNEISVPFSSSFLIKTPVPSKHLKDVKKIQLLYLNSIGNISRTQTISDSIVFEGVSAVVQGTIGGFGITATAITASRNLQDGSSALNIEKDGVISGSSVLLRQSYEGNTYTLLDTTNGTIDAKNVGRQIVSDSSEYSISNVDHDDFDTFVEKAHYPITFLKEETHIGISFQARGFYNGDASGQSKIRFSIATPVASSSVASTTVDYYDSWNSNALNQDYTLPVIEHGASQISSSISLGTSGSSLVAIPDSAKGKYCKIILSLSQDVIGGVQDNVSTKVKNISIFASRQFAGNIITHTISGSQSPDSTT